MSDLKQHITDEVKTAMKAGEKIRLGTLRLITAAIKQREVDERIELGTTDVIAILDKMVKQRRESIVQYDKADREDLSSVEKAELLIIQEFMPQALSDEEISSQVKAAIAETGAADIKSMGKVMGVLKPAMAGRADMSAVSALVRAELTKS